MIYNILTISRSLVIHRKEAQEAGTRECFETSFVNSIRKEVQVKQTGRESSRCQQSEIKNYKA